MQLNKGLNLDGLPDTVETGDYRYAENVVLDNTYRFPTNENGLLDIGFTFDDVVGIIPFDKGMIIFAKDNNISNIKVVFTNLQTDTKEYIKYNYNIPSIEFTKEQPIRGTTSYNQRGDLICIFSCGVNGNWEDKIINFNSFETKPNCTKTGTYPNEKYTYALDTNDIYLLDINPNVQFPNIESSSTSGSLLTGSYQIAVCYKIDKEYTNYSLLSLPYYIYGHDSAGDGLQDGLAPNSISTEGIHYIFNDLDNKYSYYRIAVIFNNGTVFKVYNTPDIKIKSLDNSYDIKDINILDISILDEVLIKSIFYSNSETLNIMNNRLYRANLRGHNIIGFDEVAQDLANKVKLELVSHTITDTELSDNIKSKQFIKFQNDEVYALYLTLGDKKGNVLGSYPINSLDTIGDISNCNTTPNDITEHKEYDINPLTLNKTVTNNPIITNITRTVNSYQKHIEPLGEIPYEFKQDRTPNSLSLTRVLESSSDDCSVIDLTNKDYNITFEQALDYSGHEIAVFTDTPVANDTDISFYVKYRTSATTWEYKLFSVTILQDTSIISRYFQPEELPNADFNYTFAELLTVHPHKILKVVVDTNSPTDTTYNFIFKDINNTVLFTEYITLLADTNEATKDFTTYINTPYNSVTYSSSVIKYNYTATLGYGINKDLDIRVRFRDVNGNVGLDVYKTIPANDTSISFVNTLHNDGTRKLIALSGYELTDFYVEIPKEIQSPVKFYNAISDQVYVDAYVIDNIDEENIVNFVNQNELFTIPINSKLSNKIPLYVYPQTTVELVYAIGSLNQNRCWITLDNNVSEDTTFNWVMIDVDEQGSYPNFTYPVIVRANTKISEDILVTKSTLKVNEINKINKPLDTLDFNISFNNNLLNNFSFDYRFIDKDITTNKTLTVDTNTNTKVSNTVSFKVYSLIDTSELVPILVSTPQITDILNINVSTLINVIENINIKYTVLGNNKDFNILPNSKVSIENYTFHGNNNTIITLYYQNKNTNILHLSYTVETPLFETLRLTTNFKDINNNILQTILSNFNKSETTLIIPSRHTLINNNSIEFDTNKAPVLIDGFTKYYTIAKERDCYELDVTTPNKVKYTTNHIEITLQEVDNTLKEFKDIIGFWCIHRALRTNNNSKIYTQGITCAQPLTGIGYKETPITGSSGIVNMDLPSALIYINPYAVQYDYQNSGNSYSNPGYKSIYEQNGEYYIYGFNIHKHNINYKNQVRFYSFEDLFNKLDSFPINKIEYISRYNYKLNNVSTIGIEKLYKDETTYYNSIDIVSQILKEGNNFDISNEVLESTRILNVTNNIYDISDANVNFRASVHRCNILNNIDNNFYNNIYDETIVLCSVINKLSKNTISAIGDTFYSYNYFKFKRLANTIIQSIYYFVKHHNYYFPGSSTPTEYLNDAWVKSKTITYDISVLIESKYNVHARYWEGDYPDYDQPINTATQLGYNKVYNLQNTEDVVEVVDVLNNDNRKLPTTYNSRIIKSSTANAESNQLGFRKYLALDYFDMPYNRGAIKSLYSTYKNMYIQQELSLAIASVKDVISYQDGATYVGTGQLFDRQPQETIPTGYGYVGCESFYNTGICDLGYWVIDSIQSQIFLITDEGIVILTDGKCKHWFKDKLHGVNPFKNQGSYITYDKQLKRFLLTVTNDNSSKAFTISYIPEIKNWLSFHRYTPVYGCYTRNDTYYLFNVDTSKFAFFKYVDTIKSQLKTNVIKLDNKTISFVGEQLKLNGVNATNEELIKYKSIIRHNFTNITKMILSIYHNDNPNTNKLYESINWDTSFDINNVDIYDKTFTSLNITNDSQNTGVVSLNDNTEWWDASKGVYKNNVWFFNRIFDYVKNNKDSIFKTNPSDIYDTFDIDNSNINTALEWFEISNFISTFVAITFVFDNLYYSAKEQQKGLTSDNNKVQPKLSLKNIDVDYRRNNR